MQLHLPILYTGYRSKPPLCITDGEIHIKASMGSGNLEYSIDGGTTWQIDSFFTGLAVGTYTIKIGDRGSICEAEGDAVTLSDACACPDISITTSDLTSCTAADGSIQIRSISNAPQFEIEYSLNGSNWGHQDKFEDLMQIESTAQVFAMPMVLVWYNGKLFLTDPKSLL